MKFKVSVVAALSVLLLSFVSKERGYKYNYVFTDLVCTIGGKEEEVLGILDFDVDPEGKIFIADFRENQIVIYSGQGKRLYAFGRKGKGPGEFLTPFAICVYHDRVFVVDAGNRRIQIFTKKGDYLESFRYPLKGMVNMVWYLAALEDRLFFVTDFTKRKRDLWSYDWDFWLSDLNGNNIKNFLSYATFIIPGGGYRADPFLPAFPEVSGDKIFIADNGKYPRYRIFIYSSSGKKLKQIEREYKVRKVPRAMKEYIEKRIRSSSPETFINPLGKKFRLEIPFPKYVPAIKDIAIDGDKLLVRTWEDWWKAVKREKDESKRRYEIDVYSTEGEYLGRGITNLDLGLRRTIFTRDFIYEMTEIPPYYEMVIHVYRRSH